MTSLVIELSRRWESRIARHCDRHRFADVDPAETDLPDELVAALGKVGAGGTAEAGELSAMLIGIAAGEPAGYQSLLFALKHGASRQADLSALDVPDEPLARPHDDDAAFYATARLVDHLDTAALAAWRAFTGRFVLPDMAVLDLMASHDSHLPHGLQPARMVGLGMNAEELAQNPVLTERIVHDLNARPALPLPFSPATFDCVLCALSIEYLVRPEAVLRDVRRVLKPGGHCVISFSERWFPPKAVAAWSGMHPFARIAWVLRHLQRAGFVDLHSETLRGLPRPPDDKYFRQTQAADPLYAVWGMAQPEACR